MSIHNKLFTHKLDLSDDSIFQDIEKDNSKYKSRNNYQLVYLTKSHPIINQPTYTTVKTKDKSQTDTKFKRTIDKWYFITSMNFSIAELDIFKQNYHIEKEMML